MIFVLTGMKNHEYPTIGFVDGEAKGTPGIWNHVTDQIGMFTCTGLTKAFPSFSGLKT